MQKNGHLKKVFPGGNTAEGFYSFYQYIIPPDATRIFIIKGGPGVGKSTFMKHIGEKMLTNGYDVEYHCCSSDNGSIDGVVIPAINVALIDGTAPHIVDPKNPGAVDEIIHLGDYWHEEEMRKHKTAILQINREVGRCFRRAYGYLAQAKLLNEEIESYYLDSCALNLVEINQASRELISEIVPNGIYTGQVPRERHLFGSGITPKGPCHYLDTIFDNLDKRYIISGEAGTGKSTIVEKIYRTALQQGYDVEAYHCSLVPAKLEHLVLPQLKVGIITSAGPHLYAAKTTDFMLDTMQYIDFAKLLPFHEDLMEAKTRYQLAFERAISYIARAKSAHDEMETYYIPNMDFAGIDLCRNKILQRILNYAQE